MKTSKTICPYDCPTSCGLLATHDDTRVHKVKGDPDDPVTGGVICNKMQRYDLSINAPDRILTPLKRTGDKGAGEFTPISWDEAITTIAERFEKTLEEHGPDAVLPYYYSGVMSLIQRTGGEAFFNRMGACSLIKTLCSSAKGAGYKAVMGSTGCLDPRELEHSDFLLVWGSNMRATRIQSMATMARARKKGTRVVLIETCATDMAPSCDEVILITPGTDGALALAMMHVVVEEGLADEEFLGNEAIGFNEFRATLGQYTPEWAATLTGIPAETISALAKEFGAAKAPAIVLGSGNSRYTNGGMTVRLITILSAFTGAWAKPGGGLCGCSPGGGPYVDTTRITRPDLRTNTARRVNINRLASALAGEPSQPPIRCLYMWGVNPVGSVANQQGIINGLSNPDLFTVVHERFMTDTARYADIILPATFSVEQSDLHTAYGYCSFGVSRKLVPAPGECKSNWDIFRRLAEAMGFEEDHFYRDEDDLIDELLNDPQSGLNTLPADQLAELKKGGVISTPFADHTDWQTPSGKMLIVNDELADPMPHYLESHGDSHPLRLIAVPSVQTLNSIFLERDELVDRRGPMTLGMHPDDAAARGIEDNDEVRAFNDLGEVYFMAKVTPLVARGAVVAQGVYQAGKEGRQLVNTLHHERLSDIGEATTLNDNTVEVAKI